MDTLLRQARYSKEQLRELRAIMAGSAGRGRLELREDGDGGPTIIGYASVFDSWYQVTDWLGEYDERVRPAAFAKTLAEQADVRLLLNHEGAPFARTKSGTLELAEDEVGLRYEAVLEPSDPEVQALVPKLRRGDLAESSMAFQAMQQRWNADYTERDIIEARLFDVSIVTFPASPTTSAGLRFADAIDVLNRGGDELARELRSAGDTVTREQLEEARDRLDALLFGDVDETAVDEPDAEEAGERDTSATMNLETAKRHLELVELGG